MSRNHEFNNAAARPVEIQIGARVAKLSRPNRIEFNKLKHRQENAMTALLDRLAHQREESVTAYTVAFFEAQTTHAAMHLRPKHLKPSRDALARDARQNAEQRVDFAEKEAIDRLNTRFVEAQVSFVHAAEFGEKMGRDFQKANRDHSRTRSTGRPR